MEDINDKLKLLSYEIEFCQKKGEFKPLNRVYFAVPGKTQDQFPYFSSLCNWLFKELATDFIEWSEFDDPGQVCQSIVDAAKKIGFKPDFAAAKLRTGSGEPVCIVLSHILDAVLAHHGFKVQAPMYVNAEMTEEAAVGDNLDGATEEQVEEAEDEDAADYFGPQGGKAEDEPKADMLEAKIDPAAWRLELERVGPKLKVRGKVTHKEWRTHLDQSAKHEKLLMQTFPELKATLDKIGKELRKAAERVAAKERHINKEFDHLGAAFRTKQKQLDAVQETVSELNQSVADYEAELAQKTEALDIIKTQFENRGASVTDTSPLRRISNTLQQLKDEIQQMELRIGVVGQTLLQSKIKAINQAHLKRSGARGKA